MTILLHICCAPCAIYPIEVLKNKGHKVTGFFYNPNIHPYSEYLRREEEARKYAGQIGLDLICGDYDIETYFQRIVHDETPRNRCAVCWRLRLERSATLARDKGFDAFTTTLLASPYQDQDVIKNIGEEIARGSGVSFDYNDFRPGFKEAHSIARSKGMYCQNYCGCVFSEKEKLETRRSGSILPCSI